MKNVTLIVAGLLTVASSLAAEPPLVSNAEIEWRSLEGTLAEAVQDWAESVGTRGWLGWEVPMVEGDQVLCCRQRAGRRWQVEACALEGPRRQFLYSSDRPPSFMKSDTLVVLLRERGLLKGDSKFYVSLAHDDADLAQTLGAIEESAAIMASEDSAKHLLQAFAQAQKGPKSSKSR